jgi:hypothetical protein
MHLAVACGNSCLSCSDLRFADAQAIAVQENDASRAREHGVDFSVTAELFLRGINRELNAVGRGLDGVRQEAGGWRGLGGMRGTRADQRGKHCGSQHDRSLDFLCAGPRRPLRSPCLIQVSVDCHIAVATPTITRSTSCRVE